MTMSSLTRAAAALLLAAPLSAQQIGGPAESRPAKVAKAPMPAAEWGKIETLGASALSPDGKWVAYDLRRDAGGGELHWKALVGEADHAVRNGSGETFSSNSRWLVYTIAPDTAGGRGGRAGRAGGTPGAGTGTSAAGAPANTKSKVGIVDLKGGTTSVLEDVQSYAFSKDGSHIALRRASANGRRGADLVIRNLEQNSDVTMGNVAEFAWSDVGATLAMTIDVDGKTGNGVQLLNASTGAIRSLDAGDLLYSNLQWRPRSDDLVAMRSRIDSTYADTSYDVLAWRAVGSTRAVKSSYEFAKDAKFPAGMRVAAYRRPQWSDDGATLFFGIAPHDVKPIPVERGTPGAARVEVWHWKDVREYHQQNRQSAQDRQKTHLVAWHLDKPAIVRLADDSMETVVLAENEKTALTWDEAPYFKEVLSGRQYRDVFTVDLATGSRTKIVTKTPFAPTMSADGRYVLYSQDGHWFTYDVNTGARANLTSAIKTSFVDMEDDHPVADRRPYGVAGWTTGAQSVLLYDRFDVWQVKPNGADPVRLTKGKEDATVYRVANEGRRGGRGAGGFGGPQAPIDPEDRWIDPAKPITLSATGEFTKQSGYARLTIGQPLRRVLWADKGIARLDKAKDADVYSYVTQTYEESPNLFVGTSAFTDAKQVSHTNAMLGQYAWGKQVLMDYTTKRGEKLQMMLTYPADYQPGKKYPMVVYYYEKLSQGYHDFVVPTEKSSYNTTVFSQNGYFVLRPDILFHAREPGYSGLDCVTAAVKTAVATGMIDEKKVGNMGHSWGGYQSAFYAVHGNGMFAATIAGAPLTDLISMYGYTSYNTGAAETGHFETGQERMQVPLWEDPQSYIRNSTVFAVDSLRTPLLLEEGDADGNVNYWQSMELYNFGRRLGKEVIFLVYNGENHSVARPESQLDYHRRQLEWFDHYLKGAPAPDWMTKGESFLTRQKMLTPSAPAAGSAAPTPVTAGGITGAYAP
ncbi:MAG: prolyl oligopeptidase family serine peptidase [bacterium]